MTLNRLAPVLFLLLLAGAVTSESLLVTVTYQNQQIQITHAEVIAPDASPAGNVGYFTLAYGAGSQPVPAAKLDLPIFTITEQQGITAEDYAERTIVIPFQRGAPSLSLYDPNQTKISTLSLNGLTSVGSSVGPAPKESIAGQSGKTSVASALAESSGGTPPAGASNSPNGLSGSPSAASASCLGPAVLLGLLALAGLSRL